MKITNSKSASTAQKSSYVRVTITEDKRSKTIEHAEGVTEMVFGVGAFKDITIHDYMSICRRIIRTALQQQYERIAVDTKAFSFPQIKDQSSSWVLSTMIENFLLAEYEFTKYKSDTSDTHVIKEVCVCGTLNTSEKRGLERGKAIGTYANICRDIANTAGGDMTPELLGREARKAAKDTKVNVDVLGQKEIEKLKMGLLLGVARGSKIAPRFIIMEYWGAGKPTKNTKGKSKRPLVFVGKGITYDTGGLSIKPSDGMLDMHLDMSGGAAVIAAVTCAAKLGLRKNVVGLIPAAENAVSDQSMRPGDVLTSMSGKTVDVLNTDAEGRLVLADALTYAKRYEPRAVIDVATLTGAALVGLGEHVSAVLSSNEEFAMKLKEVSDGTGDRVWPLPLWKIHKEHVKGRFGDIANIRPTNGRYGGTIEGAAFLAYFIHDYPSYCKWAHIDMAPRMTSVHSDHLAKGATGEPVRLLVKLAETL